MMGTLQHSTAAGPPSLSPGTSSPERVLPKLKISRLNFFYGGYQALHDIALEIAANRITALIGPSGCGKSTFLRVLNRMFETVRGARASGEVLLDGPMSAVMRLAAISRAIS